MRDSARTLVFATVLGIVCSLLLAAVNLYTSPYRKANEKAEEIFNFLSVLGIQVDPSWDSKTMIDVFNKNVRVKELGGLTLYENVFNPSSPGTPVAVAVPFSGMGLWGPIRGVLSLEPDLLTIKGVRFYQQEETPGLGGEIGSEWFQKQFDGKEIVSVTGEPGFRVLKPGSPTDKNSVDGITGATMTSERVQGILDGLVKELWQEGRSNGGE